MQAAMSLLLISYGGTLPYCHTSMNVNAVHTWLHK